MSAVTLILASQSPRRRELLALLGLPFEVFPAAVEEAAVDGESPAQTAVRLALEKARTVVAARPGATVIGCDTLVAVDGAVLGKPADAAQARAMLRSLRGRAHSVYSGVAVIGGGRQVVELVETTVTMRDYTDAEIERYIASGAPFDKAGAYGIQCEPFRPAAAWSGCYLNVMGLPLCALARALGALDIVPPVDAAAACQAYRSSLIADRSSLIADRGLLIADCLSPNDESTERRAMGNERRAINNERTR